MPISFDKAFGIARGVKAFLFPHSSTTRRMPSEQRKRIKSKSRELFKVQRVLRVAKDNVERSKQKKRRKRIQQEIFELRRELPTAEAQGAQVAPYGRPTPQATGESAVGALPTSLSSGPRRAEQPSSTTSSPSTRSSSAPPRRRCTSSTRSSTRASRGTAGASRRRDVRTDGGPSPERPPH